MTMIPFFLDETVEKKSMDYKPNSFGGHKPLV